MKKYLRDNGKISYIAAAVIIFLAVFILFRKLFFGEIIATNDASTNDLLFFMLPVRTLYGEALKNGEILQWTSLIYSGFPLLAEGQGGFLYPVNLILCYLLNPFQAMNSFIIFHVLVMGIGFFVFTSKITGSTWSAITAGAAASICGSMVVDTRHINAIAVISYSPWLFVLAESYLRRFRVSSALLFGTVLGLMLLIGHPQNSFVSGFAVTLYILLRLYFLYKDKNYKVPKKTDENKSKFLIKKTILFGIISIAAALAISYVQVRDTMELASLSQRGVGVTSEFTGMGSLPWNGFLTFIYPYYAGNAGNNTYELQNVYMFWEIFHYVGTVVLVLALIGICTSWKNQYVKTLAILGLISFLFALGNNLPLYKIFAIVPFVKSFRFPVRFLLGTEISILALSGFGVLSIVNKLTEKSPSVSTGKNKKGPPAKKTEGGLKTYLRRKPHTVGVVFSILAIIDIYAVAGKQVATADPRVFFDSSALVTGYNKNNEFRRMFTIGNVEYFLTAYNKSKGWEGDKSLYSLGTKLLPPDLSAYYHIPTVAGYTQLVPTYIVEMWGDALNGGAVIKTAFLKDKQSLTLKPPFIKLARMWGVKDFMSYYNLPEPLQVKWDSAGIKRYELPEILLHAWVVKEAVPVPEDNPKLVSDMLLDNKFIPTEKALVSGAAPKLPENSENGKTEVIEAKNNYVKIKALSPGLVVLSDTWYPRWKAKVDGADAEIYRVNNMMRGIIAPKTGSEIEMYYDEGNVKLFLIISILVIAGIFGYGLVEYLKNRAQLREPLNMNSGKDP